MAQATGETLSPKYSRRRYFVRLVQEKDELRHQHGTNMEKYDLRDVLVPYEKLIEIDICGTLQMVPENNTLLRCFQYLATESISYGDFCWNGECINCQVWLQNGDKEKAVMACRTVVQENMKILRLSEGIDLSNE